MTIDQRALAQIQREQFAPFATLAFREVRPRADFRPNMCFLAIAHALGEVAAGRTKRLLVSLPPRSGKSIVGSVALPAFVLGKDPTKRIICASYSMELATTHARDCRHLMRTPFYRRLFPATKICKSTESEIETAHQGSRFTTSVGGTLTGRGGSLIIIDDPQKPDEAASKIVREKAWDWFTGTVGSRLDNIAEDAMIVIMQRLHAEDLAGRLLDRGGWTHLNLPAIAQEYQEIPIGQNRMFVRNIGDVLDPVRSPMEALEQVKRDIGSANFAAQYQQDPVPEDGGFVKWGWFRTYERSPSLVAGDWLVMSWDTAMTSSELSDYSVGIRALVKPTNEVYILDIVRKRVDYPALRHLVLQEGGRPTAATLIEAAGSGLPLLQELKGRIGLIPVRPYGEKAMRFQAATLMIEGQQVFLPAKATWLLDFKRELLSFPNGSNDDQVDALSQLLNWVHSRQNRRPLHGRYSMHGD